MSTNIYNLSSPLRTGRVKLAPSGKELFGTVIRQGRMPKTVTVSEASCKSRLDLTNPIHRCEYLAIITTTSSRFGWDAAAISIATTKNSFAVLVTKWSFDNAARYRPSSTTTSETLFHPSWDSPLTTKLAKMAPLLSLNMSKTRSTTIKSSEIGLLQRFDWLAELLLRWFIK